MDLFRYIFTRIKDVYDMVQACRVMYSRKQWKRKAVKRGVEVREMRKAIKRKNAQIAQLKDRLNQQDNISYCPTVLEPHNNEDKGSKKKG